MNTTATAVVHRQENAGDLRLRSPRVRVDGQPRDDLRVASLTIVGPADRRAAVLVRDRQAGGNDAAEREAHAALIGRHVVIEMAVDLPCGDAAALGLLDGRIVGWSGRWSGTDDALALTAGDAWADELEREVDLADVRTVGEAVQRIADVVGSDKLRAAMEAAALLRPIRFDGATTVGRALDALGERHGIVARRFGSGVALREHRRGRPMVVWQGTGLNGQAVTRRRWAGGEATPRQLIGRMAGEVVESTYELSPGWSAADETGTDADYAPGTSTDWPRFANVYRRWRLAWADGIDVAGGFGDCLTRDAEGNRLFPITDYSTDAGITWQTFGGRVERSATEPAVWLADAGLPDAFFTAVRAGDVRLRITATLRSAVPIERVRWAGNPFAGPFARRIVNAGDDLSVRRVAAGSRFADAVAAGQMLADTRDDRPVLDQMLVDAAANVTHRLADGSSEYHLAHPMLGLAVGDGLVDATGGPAMIADGPRQVVMRIEHRWGEEPGTRITTREREGQE